MEVTQILLLLSTVFLRVSTKHLLQKILLELRLQLKISLQMEHKVANSTKQQHIQIQNMLEMAVLQTHFSMEHHTIFLSMNHGLMELGKKVHGALAIMIQRNISKSLEIYLQMMMKVRYYSHQKELAMQLQQQDQRWIQVKLKIHAFHSNSMPILVVRVNYKYSQM